MKVNQKLKFVISTVDFSVYLPMPNPWQVPVLGYPNVRIGKHLLHASQISSSFPYSILEQVNSVAIR